MPERPKLATPRHLPDHRMPELPPIENLLHRGDHLGPHDRDHPLLALGDHHLPGLHALLPLRNPVQMHVDAVLGGHLGERRRDPGRAAVLQGLDEPHLHELDRGLDQLLPRKRVSDLDGGSLLGRGLVQLLAREHRSAPDPVPSGRRAVENDELAASGRLRAQDAVDREQPDAHRVHEAVVPVRLVEDRLATDGRNAHRVAVGADPGDGARERVTRLGEAQAVEQRDRARTHRDDVPENPADPRRGALERLHRRGMVVAFHLERDREPVPEVEDAGILARPLQDALAGAREPLQEKRRVLVPAVLRPEQREHRELEVVRVAAEEGADALVLPVGEAEGAMERLLRHAAQRLAV